MTSRTLPSNTPLQLDDPDLALRVDAGALALFHLAPHTPRHLLFELTPGDHLLGLPSHPHSLLALTLEPTTLHDLPDPDPTQRLAWTTRLLAALLPPPPTASPLPPGQHTVADEEARLVERPLQVTVTRGEVALAGVAPLPHDQPTLLVPPLWLSVRDAEVHVAEADPEPKALASLCLDALTRRHQRAHDDERARGEERRAREEEAAAETWAGVEALLRRDDAAADRGDPLLTAATWVGQACGIEICRPVDLGLRLKDPLVLIARASGCRVRRVTLEADWWRRDAGPLLGVVGEEERPVALLPRRGRYEAIDPVRGQRWTVDAASAEDVSLAAHSFHPALPAQLHDLGGLLRFGLRGRGADLAAIFAAGLVAALLGMLAPVATGYLMGTAIPDADVLSLWHVSAGLVAAAIGALSFTLIQGLITTRMGISADVATQTALWDRVLRTHVAALRRWSTGDLQSRLLAVSQVARQLHGVTLSTLLSGVLALLNAGLMLYYSPELAAWGLGAGVLAVALSAALGRAAARRELALQEGQGALHGTVIQLVGAVPKLRVANAEARGFTQWLRRLTPQLRLQDEIRGYQDLLAAWSLALPTLTAMVLFYALSDSLLEAQTDPSEAPLGTGDFLAFHAAFGVFLMGLNKLSDMVVTLASAFATARRVRPILEAPPEVPEHAASPGRLRGAFALQGVTFRYRSDGAKILDTVSLHADPGEFVALVGPSGSGKSTILRLLLGFEVCESGSVRFDGQDLSGLDPGAVRQQLGIVLQSGRLSYGSILDNVTGSLDLELHEVWQALEDAGLAEDVRALPMQLHTHVSEGGGNLSGGQRQRLLIARALAKNPRLILFDEATSALDNRTQAIVSRALERRRATRLVVAHRLSTIEHADRIYVLEDGRVVQTGTFTELRDQPGLFQRLAARQTT